MVSIYGNPRTILPQVGYRLHYILISRGEIMYIMDQVTENKPIGPIQLVFVTSCYIDFLQLIPF